MVHTEHGSSGKAAKNRTGGDSFALQMRNMSSPWDGAFAKWGLTQDEEWKTTPCFPETEEGPVGVDAFSSVSLQKKT